MRELNLFEISNPKQWKTISSEELMEDGQYPVYGANGIIGFYDKYNHEKETVLITCRGATCGEVNLSKPFSYINGNAMALDDIDENLLSTKYLYYYFKQYNFQSVISGSAQPQITRAGLKNVSVPVPDLQTQNKIVAILDKVSALVQKRQQTIDLLDELLRAQFLEMFGEAPLNPNRWEYKDLGSLLNFLTSGSRGWAKHYSEEGDIFLRINNLGYNELLLNDLVFVDAPESAEARRTEVKSGDVLLSITADLGRTAVIPENLDRAFVNQHIAILRPNESINPYFLSEYISSEGGRHLIVKYSKGAAKSGLNFNDIKSLKIFLPPKSIQDKFEKIYKKNKTLKSGLISNKELIQSLFSATLQRAFSGKLDLDVSVELDALLEEIDLQKPENDLFSIITNEEYLMILVNRINNQEYENQDLYDKAKHVAFQLLKKEERLAQEYDEQTQSLKLVVK
jgi:type I restriction enzyme S subunit